MKNKKILIIDCNAVCWHVFHALPPLAVSEQGTAVIYGFFTQLLNIQAYTQAHRIVFAWDSAKSKRMDIFPDYKKKRRKLQKECTPEEKKIHKDRKKQFDLLRKEILPSIGFKNIFMENGLEGDDIIASIALKYRKKNYIKIIARDNDLFQLLNSTCVMYDIKTRTLLDEEWFFNKYGIYPDMWGAVKSLAGCKGDEVPGIVGIGEGRAIDYLLKKMNPRSKLFQKIESSKDVIKLTEKLVVLPYEGTPSYKLKKDKCSLTAFKRMARKYKLKSFMIPDKLLEFKRSFIENA